MDGKFAVSKSPLDTEMSVLLHDLLGIVKVAVISGGSCLQFKKQFFSNLPHDGRLNSLSLLPVYGTHFYRYNCELGKIYSEDFNGVEKKKIIDSLRKALADVSFKIGTY